MNEAETRAELFAMPAKIKPENVGRKPLDEFPCSRVPVQDEVITHGGLGDVRRAIEFTEI